MALLGHRNIHTPDKTVTLSNLSPSTTTIHVSCCIDSGVAILEDSFQLQGKTSEFNLTTIYTKYRHDHDYNKKLNFNEHFHKLSMQ